jgi:hypothetical protein
MRHDPQRLEPAGVEFIAENGGGAGVRLRKGGRDKREVGLAHKSTVPPDSRVSHFTVKIQR